MKSKTKSDPNMSFLEFLGDSDSAKADDCNTKLKSIRDPQPPPNPGEDFGPQPPVDVCMPEPGVESGMVLDLMARAISPPGRVNYTYVKQYRDDILKSAGNPSDPIERMLIEQFAASHAMTFQMHMYTSTSVHFEHREAFSRAAVALMAENRRLALTIKEYRTVHVRAQVTKIEQRNISHQQKVNDTATCEAKRSVSPKSATSGQKAMMRGEKETPDAPRDFGREAEIRRPSCGGEAKPNAPRAIERSRPELAAAESV